MNVLFQRAKRRSGRSGQAGFTLIELAIVMVVAGLLLVPLLRMAGSAVISTRLKQTQSVLETASDALIAFAALNNGCLPFAADDEGGLPDTDDSGAAGSSPDVGNRGTGDDVNVGDLPWADLGLTNSFLDGDGLRIQYYVATPYTDTDVNVIEITCDAGFRGFQWDTSVKYEAPGSAPTWVYDFDPGSGDRTLYRIKESTTLDNGTHPNDGGSDVTIHLNQLPATLLQVRRGPDVTAASPQNDVIDAQNVFILIAPGTNRNAGINRQFVRDSTHTTSGGGTWALGTNVIDDHIFSSQPNEDTSDTANDGDDTLLVMSFTDFRKEMSKYGLNMEPVCENPC